MKVKCISNKWCYQNEWFRRHWWAKKEKKPAKGPANGDIVTVVRDYWYEGLQYYILKEWGNEHGYTAKDFIPIEEQYEQVKFSQIKEKASVN